MWFPVLRNIPTCYRQLKMSLSLHAWKLSLTNIPVQLDEKGHSALVAIPFLSSDDVNRTGNLSFWRVVHWFNVARLAAFNKPCAKTGLAFVDYNKMSEGKFTFFVSNRLSMSKRLYGLINGSLPSSEPPVFDVEVHLGHIGASTVSTVAVMTERATGEVLGKSANQVALVDKRTRKLSLVPEDWRQKYSSAVVENERLIVPVEAVPSDAVKVLSRYEVRVRWNDTDGYKHTNYLSYIKFCFDAAQDAVVSGRYAGFSGDILRYGVKEVEMVYKAETVANDNLTIVSWQDDSTPYKIHFSINKADGTVAYQSRLEFHPL